jgi:hypothetical protein
VGKWVRGRPGEARNERALSLALSSLFCIRVESKMYGVIGKVRGAGERVKRFMQTAFCLYLLVGVVWGKF